MSRKTPIAPGVRLAAYAAMLATVAAGAALLGSSGFQGWPVAVALVLIGTGLAWKQTMIARLTYVALSEFPVVAAILILDPAMAMATAALIGCIPPSRFGSVGKALNLVACALPALAAAAVLHGAAGGLLGVESPADAPLAWFFVACVAIGVDALCHSSLHALNLRLLHGTKLPGYFRDVIVPSLKYDPVSSIVTIMLVEIGWLLQGTARFLPVAIAAAAIAGVWIVLQTTRRQIDARELKDDFFRAIFVSLARLLEMKDPETAFHSARVAVFSRDIARVLGLSEEEQGRIHLAGLLHDVGKVGVPDEILLKPGRLTPEERAIMQRHARLSAEAIQGIPGFGDLVRTVYAHHERIDGSGYPEGISGDALPMGARILGVADTFEALTSDRPYRPGRPPVEALEVFEREIELFDPEVVSALRYLVLSKATDYSFRRLTDFSDEWSKAARHLEVRMEEEPFVLPPDAAGDAAAGRERVAPQVVDLTLT